ncbi:hypothetical protein B0H13DRAFT_126005 [Mycena leptocephala]|nr:hypothetical protein B0H13DRAFT_126005 [Mycena leptocephala]
MVTQERQTLVTPRSMSSSKSRGHSPSQSESEHGMDHTAGVPPPSSLTQSRSNSPTAWRSADLRLSNMIDPPPTAPVSSLLKRPLSPSATPSSNKRFKGEAAPSFIRRVFSGTQALLMSSFRSQSRVRHRTPPSPCPEQPRSSSRADGRRDFLSSQFLSPEPALTSPKSLRASLENSLGDSLPTVTRTLTKRELIVILQDHEEKIGLKLDAAVSKLEAGFFRELHFLRNSRESESGAKTTRVKPPALAHSRTPVPSDPTHVALSSPAHAAAPLANNLDTGSNPFIEPDSRRSPSRVAISGCQSQMATASDGNLFIPRMMHAVGILSNALEKCCAVCWTLTGEQHESDHSPFSSSHCGAGVLTRAIADKQFQNLCPSFPPSAGCPICWIPHVATHPHFRSTNHSLAGNTCVHPHAFKQIAWTVYWTPNLWDAFSIKLRQIQMDQPTPEHWFPERADGLANIGNTSSLMSVDQYVDWLCQHRDGMLNIGHLAYWLLGHHGSLREHKLRS